MPTIHRAVFSGVVAGTATRTAARFPAVAGSPPPTATTATTVFVFSDLRSPEFLIP